MTADWASNVVKELHRLEKNGPRTVEEKTKDCRMIRIARFDSGIGPGCAQCENDNCKIKSEPAPSIGSPEPRPESNIFDRTFGEMAQSDRQVDPKDAIRGKRTF